MGKSKKTPTIDVAQYRLTAHVGVSYAVDAVRRVALRGKDIFIGALEGVQNVNVNNPELFGGAKRQGGPVGRMVTMSGRSPAQLVPDTIAEKFGVTGATMPGFRGLCTLWFYEAPGATPGFLWQYNTTILPDVEVETTNLPRALGALNSAIPRGTRAKRSLYFSLDYSGSMSGDAITTQTAAVTSALNSIKTEIGQGLVIDVGISRMSTGSTTLGFSNATASDIDALIAFLAAPATGDTNFLATTQSSLDWFTASLSDPDIRFRFWVFSSDSEGQNVPSAATLGADLIDQSSGSFNATDDTECRIFTLSIDQSDNGSLALFDNTSIDGVPQVTSSNQDSFDAVIQRALYPYEEANDANGSHLIWEVSTTGRKKIPEARFDKQAFLGSAQTLKDEGLGLAVAITARTKRKTLIAQTEAHCDGRFQLNPNTGLLEFRLIRNDFDPLALRTITPENSRRLLYNRQSIRRTKNGVIVRWTDPETETSAATKPREDPANIAAQGRTDPVERDYFMLRTRQNAERLAARDLPKYSLPLSVGTHEVSRSLWDVIAGERLLYSDPEIGVENMVIIVTKARRGSGSTRLTQIEWLEDPSQRTVNTPDAPSESLFEDPVAVPAELAHIDFMTAPYFVVVNEIIDPTNVATPDVFVAVLGASDTIGISEYRLLGEETDSLGNESLGNLGERQTLSRTTLATALPAEATSTVAAFNTFTIGQGIEVGSLLQIGTGDIDSEIAVVSVAEPDGIGYTLSRGALDTTPKNWPVGTPVWVLNENVDFLDEVTRVFDDQADYKLLSRTTSAELAESAALLQSFTPTERPHLPSRPGNVQINGVAFGAVDRTGETDISVSWATRNRLSEDAVIVPWDSAGDVTPEANQTVTVRLLDLSRTLITDIDSATSPLTVQQASFNGETSAYVRVISKRDDGAGGIVESIQGHEILVTFTPNLLTFGADALTLGTDELTLGT